MPMLILLLWIFLKRTMLQLVFFKVLGRSLWRIWGLSSPRLAVVLLRQASVFNVTLSVVSCLWAQTSQLPTLALGDRILWLPDTALGTQLNSSDL